ncbi:MAG: aldehyde dehydrogenase family protein [Bacteroidota bacterium]
MQVLRTTTTTDDQAISELDRVFALQKAAFRQHPYPSAEERIELMERVPDMLRKNRQKILQALEQDFGGHSRQQGDLVEILGMFDRTQYNVSKVKKWMKPVRKAGNPVTLGSSKVYLKYHPKGVIGNMVSWNFPFDIAIGPMLDQLAAGNRVIIKPSDLSPASGKVLAEMIRETFDESWVAVVNGDLALAKYFPTLKWDHLTYTGSGFIGRKVMQAAAQNLVPVTLELGGKCPMVVDEASVTDETIAEIAGVKAVKRGQMCVTIDYCLVPASKMEVFAEKMIQHYQRHFTEKNGAAHACGIISDRHLQRLQGLVEEAREKGAKVTQIGESLDGSHRHMPFHVVVNPDRDLQLMQEEIFGPIMPIVPYHSLQEAIDYINDGEKPLGLYLYSQNADFIHRLTHQTQSGGVAVNIAALQAAQASLPFGGIGESGMGAHHGEEAFKEFSNPRGYFIRGKGGTFSAITPPYDNSTDHLIEEVAYAGMGKQLVFALKTLPRNLWARIFG